MKNSNWCCLGAEVAYTIFISFLNWCFWEQKSLALWQVLIIEGILGYLDAEIVVLS